MIRKLSNIKIADSYKSKIVGVIGWEDWGGCAGLLIKDANSIHTFFVRFAIDVVFLDKGFKIVKIVENLKPFRFSPIVWSAKHTLELPNGVVRKKSLHIRNKIDLI